MALDEVVPLEDSVYDSIREEVTEPLPKRILMIKRCYELLGPRITNVVRKIIGADK